MSHDAQFTHAHMVRFDCPLAGTPDEVWQTLTDARCLPAWYGMAHRPPGRRRRRADGRPHPRNRDAMPAARAATYGWNVFNPGDEVSPYPESYLTLELKPAGGDTALTLTHLPVLERFVN